VSDELWKRIGPLLPCKQRRFPYPGRKPVPVRKVLRGILYVLHTGIQWEYLPTEMSFGSGMTCWRRPRTGMSPASGSDWMRHYLPGSMPYRGSTGRAALSTPATCER
jgi:transposase